MGLSRRRCGSNVALVLSVGQFVLICREDGPTPRTIQSRTYIDGITCARGRVWYLRANSV
jgi:hypothetical protein